MISRIGRRHIRRATSRAIDQIRQRTMSMNQLKRFPLLSTHPSSLFRVIILVMLFFLVLVHLICPARTIPEHSVPSPTRLYLTPPCHSLTPLPPLPWPTSTHILSLAVKLHLNNASQLSIPNSCTILCRCTIHDVLILTFSSDTRSVVVPSSSDPNVSPVTHRDSRRNPGPPLTHTFSAGCIGHSRPDYIKN